MAGIPTLAGSSPIVRSHVANADCDSIYARVSSDGGEPELRIETQLAKIRERFCAEGRPVYREYLEKGYSGAYLNRPELDRLFADARAGRFNRVLVYHPDRLSRGEGWHRGFLERQ